MNKKFAHITYVKVAYFGYLLILDLQFSCLLELGHKGFQNFVLLVRAEGFLSKFLDTDLAGVKVVQQILLILLI